MLKFHLLDRILVHSTRTKRKQCSDCLSVTSVLSALGSTADVACHGMCFQHSLTATVQLTCFCPQSINLTFIPTLQTVQQPGSESLIPFHPFLLASTNFGLL